VLDAVEDILREEGVLDELKKSLFLSVSSVVKKQKPIQKCSQAKEFASTTDGKFSLLLVAELLSKLNLNHSMEIFALETGFTPTDDLRADLQDKFGGKLSSSLDSPLLLQMVSGAAKNEFGSAANTTVPVAEEKHSIDNVKSPQSPHIEETKTAHPKKNRSPLAAFQTSPPSKSQSSTIDLESSYDADDKSTASMDRRYFSPDKKKKGGLSPLGPSPPKKSPLASLPDVKSPSSGLPPLGNLEPLGTKRSPLGKIPGGSRGLNSSDELSHDSISKQRHDHLEDSFDQSIQSLEEKLEESKDGFEISDSFENSDVNLKQFDSPIGKQQSHVLAPLGGDALSPYSTKSDREKSQNLDDSQPEELASASFLEESEVSVASNMFDDEDCMILESPKKSDVNPTQINRVDVKQRELDSDDPATDGQVNVNVSTASTVRMTRSQVGWDNDDKERPEDDFEYIETATESKVDDKDEMPGRRSDREKTTSSDDKKIEPEVDDYEVNSDFESIEDMDAYNDDMKYNEDEIDLNASHASYRSNQEEDEEENLRLEANRAMTKDSPNQKSPSGSLFASPSRSAEEKLTSVESPSRSAKNKSLNDTDDYDDEYGDDFDQDDEEDEAEELDESIAESLEEDFEDEDNLSFGSKNDSYDDSDKEKSYMSSPTHSPTGKLPSLFTKSELPKESSAKSNMNDSQDSDPFQDKSMSFSDGGPETSLASKDDLEDFSVGEGSSGSDEFLKDEDDTSASATELSMKDQKSVGRLGESNDFSMSEHEISGSHNLNEFGVDYTTSAAPPAGGRRGGW